MKPRKIRHQFCLDEDASAKLDQPCRKASVGRAVEAFPQGMWQSLSLTGALLCARYEGILNFIFRYPLSQLRPVPEKEPEYGPDFEKFYWTALDAKPTESL